MNENKVLSFIKRLSDDTVKGKVTWQRMDDYRNRIAHSPTSPLEGALLESEFRHIDFYKSYCAVISPGDVFVIYEDVESGRETGIRSIGYKIYLWNDNTKHIAQLACPASVIYQLLNAIESCIDEQETNAEAFIDAYLNQH